MIEEISNLVTKSKPLLLNKMDFKDLADATQGGLVEVTILDD